MKIERMQSPLHGGDISILRKTAEKDQVSETYVATTDPDGGGKKGSEYYSPYRQPKASDKNDEKNSTAETTPRSLIEVERTLDITV